MRLCPAPGRHSQQLDPEPAPGCRHQPAGSAANPRRHPRLSRCGQVAGCRRRRLPAALRQRRSRRRQDQAPPDKPSSQRPRPLRRFQPLRNRVATDPKLKVLHSPERLRRCGNHSERMSVPTPGAAPATPKLNLSPKSLYGSGQWARYKRRGKTVAFVSWKKSNPCVSVVPEAMLVQLVRFVEARRPKPVLVVEDSLSWKFLFVPKPTEVRTGRMGGGGTTL